MTRQSPSYPYPAILKKERDGLENCLQQTFWPTQYIPLFIRGEITFPESDFLKEPPLKDFIAYLDGYPTFKKATVRTGHGTTNWFQLGKGVHQGCILSLCLFNLHAEYIMQNSGLDEAQDGIKVAGRNINNFRYADDTTLMAQREKALDESEKGE